MEYRSKYKAEEIEAILDAKNNTGEGVDSNLDVLFTGQLQTKEVEVSEDTTIKADEGFLGLKEVSVKVNGGGGGSASSYKYYLIDNALGGTIYLFSSTIKVQLDGMTFITPTATAVVELGDEIYNKDIVKAFCVDLNQKLYLEGQWMTMEEAARPSRYFTEITEEEFYAL